MKKRDRIQAGFFAAALLALALTAGCGPRTLKDVEKEKAVAVSEESGQKSGADETPTPGALNTVEMTVPSPSAAAREEIANKMGVQSATTKELVIVNSTGDTVTTFYVRVHPGMNADDDEWGDELIGGAFTLANGDKALYYLESAAQTTTYDLRIGYFDENKSECFFRNIPLQTVGTITLRMEGSGEDAIPYATYTQGDSRSEVSTLKEVKQRLGLIDGVTPTPAQSSSSASQQSTQSSSQSSSSVTTAPSGGSQTVTEDPGYNEESGTFVEDPGVMTDQGTTAQGYIGSDLDALVGAVGSPTGSDYDETDDGTTGYHYYNGFTVSTIVDDEGNEVVAGVW